MYKAQDIHQEYARFHRMYQPRLVIRNCRLSVISMNILHNSIKKRVAIYQESLERCIYQIQRKSHPDELAC